MGRKNHNREAPKNNPWELLVIASLFFVPGITLLRQKGPVLLIQPRRITSTLTFLTPGVAHVFGWCAIVVGLLLIGLYFYARWAIAREEKTDPPHFLDL